MSKLSAIDHLTAMSTRLTGMSEVFRILYEYDQPIRPVLYDYLSWSAEKMGMECDKIAEEIASEKE